MLVESYLCKSERAPCHRVSLRGPRISDLLAVLTFRSLPMIMSFEKVLRFVLQIRNVFITSSIAAKMSSFVYCLYLAGKRWFISCVWMQWEFSERCQPLPFDFAVGPNGLDHARRRGGVLVQVVHIVVHVQGRHRHWSLKNKMELDCKAWRVREKWFTWPSVLIPSSSITRWPGSWEIKM